MKLRDACKDLQKAFCQGEEKKVAQHLIYDPFSVTHIKVRMFWLREKFYETFSFIRLLLIPSSVFFSSPDDLPKKIFKSTRKKRCVGSLIAYIK